MNRSKTEGEYSIMAVLKITKENYESSVVKSEKPVLLDFWASWCGPCKMMSPVVDEIADENPDYVVGKVNVDEEPDLAQLFGIISIPTIVAMEKGEVLNQVVGVCPKDRVLSMLDKN